MKYTVKKQNGEFIVVNSLGYIIAYCDTRLQAMDVAQAQTMDEERQAVMTAFNKTQADRAMYAAFMAEFA